MGFDFQKFYMGDCFDAYQYLGAHLTEDGAVFRTFAPNAERVMLIGDFNGWQEQEMTERVRAEFFECTVPGAREGQMYKYVIYGKNGRYEHCDPYGFGMELRPGFASVLRDLRSYTFQDDKWMQERTLCYDSPLNIYEMHLGSWRRKDSAAEKEQDGDEEQTRVEDGWYRYDEIAEPLIAYLRENHYTHVEFMPLSEHPFDGSWGYQNTGFFAPTSRYGTAAQLRELIDRLHRAGFGAILDFVPAHFARDSYGLLKYDGTSLYELPSSDVSDSEWGTCNFMYSRREVISFMQSAANYWLAEYHFDGLRMDAVSRLIYWQGEEWRGVNPENIAFLKRMNHGIRCLHPTAMLIAEDSTSYPGCTVPADRGGLGFDYKWDLGWMNDTLDYFKKTSEERAGVPEKLTFSMYYFFNERYLLPLSHDEVVHGKKTIIDKIFGPYEEKFPQARALYMYMYLHPGKKLNFMGNEIAMFREWDERKAPDMFLLKYPLHDSFHEYMKELNRLYRELPALSEMDYQPEGFSWITMNDRGHDVFGIRRNGRHSAAFALFNFSSSEQTYYHVPEQDDALRLRLHSDWERFSGGTKETYVTVQMKKGRTQPFILPAYTAVLYDVL